MTRRCVVTAVCHVNRFTHCRMLWPCFAFRRQVAARPARRLRSHRPLQARPRRMTAAVAGRMVQTAPRTRQTPFRKTGSRLKNGKSESIHVYLCSALGSPVGYTHRSHSYLWHRIVIPVHRLVPGDMNTMHFRHLSFGGSRARPKLRDRNKPLAAITLSGMMLLATPPRP